MSFEQIMILYILAVIFGGFAGYGLKTGIDAFKGVLEQEKNRS